MIRQGISCLLPIYLSSLHSKFRSAVRFSGLSYSIAIGMSSPKDFVESKLNSRKVVVFSKTWCGFCRMAKDALKPFNLSEETCEVVELDKMDGGDAIQTYLAKLTGARSVPRVFIGGRCIGGGTETAAAARNGDLRKWLAGCGAVV